jgi:uncharacterized coiled-coil protein SlyX
MTELAYLAERVRQLEELLSHEAHRYEQLNAAVVSLRAEFDRTAAALARRIEQLESRIDDRSATLDPDEKPPHY